MIRTFGVGELHLSLVSGRWEYDRWGDPTYGASPSGAELWAYLEDPYVSSVCSTIHIESDVIDSTQWKGMTNALAGLFCTSLNRLDGTKTTTSPAYSYLSTLNATHSLQHGLLPVEFPCTENLTPFLSLLPCTNKAGLGALLNPHRLFDTNWQKIGVHIMTVHDERIELSLEVEAVYDPTRLDMAKGGIGKRDWDFEMLYGRKQIPQGCPLARGGSNIQLHGVSEQQELVPSRSEWRTSATGLQLAMDKDKRIASTWPAEAIFDHGKRCSVYKD